jgi:hypothetical protein
MMIM